MRMSRAGVNPNDLTLALIEELDCVLRDNLLLSFRKEPREAMLTIVKASAVLNLLIRRV